MDRSARSVIFSLLLTDCYPGIGWDVMADLAALAVVDFFNHVNMLYGTISEFCTPTEVSLIQSACAHSSQCPIMNAGPKLVSSIAITKGPAWSRAMIWAHK